jgi:hypothetical protein
MSENRTETIPPVCKWHPLHSLPCPVCYLRSFDSYRTKSFCVPVEGKGFTYPGWTDEDAPVRSPEPILGPADHGEGR